MHYVYGLFDPRDGKLRYVGYSTNPNRRYKEHLNIHHLKRSLTRNTNWGLSLRKQGLKSIMKIIEVCETLEQGVKREAYWIRFFRKKNCNLNNHLDGGDGTTLCALSEKSKKRISDKLKLYYKNNPEHYKKTCEHLKKYREDNCGPRTGIPCSEETKKKIGIANSGRVHTKAEILKRINSLKKRIFCHELNQEFPSQKEAAEFLNIDSRSISKVCLGKRKTCGGYTFSFIKE